MQVFLHSGLYILNSAILPFSEPPSEVRNITTVGVNQTMVNLTWTRPADLGGRTDLLYTVSCLGCPQEVRYTPRKEHLNQTKCVPFLYILTLKQGKHQRGVETV